MIVRMATYRYRGDAQELAGRAERGILPLLEEQSGFQAYTVAADETEVISASVWSSRGEAETGSEVVAAWVADNMADEIELIGVRYADLLISTALGVHA
jgi:heme-degrading monooxygenase HmoA